MIILKAAILYFFIGGVITPLWAESDYALPEEREEQQQITQSSEVSPVDERVDMVVERIKSNWGNGQRKTVGVVIAFHQWPPDSHQANIIEEHLKTAGLEKTETIESFKAWVFSWPELMLHEKAIEVCKNLPEMAILDFCESNALPITNYW